VIEAKDNDKDKFLNEAADLMFHYLLLLNSKGFKLDEVIDILKKRHKK
jgi:phosphoribosyl-ATP pyrophosphohydrolase/phosphoribosyl-AMP cyclohydrolase